VGSFELLERDGLARIGRLSTAHGPIETPALLPVVHPDPDRQTVRPQEMRDRLGVRAVITSAYITRRTPSLRARAEREGIHGLLDFPGPVMTDSGAFQQHMYGSVEVGPEEILAFQQTIGTDIATVLDVFTEPEAAPESARAALESTLERARRARQERSGLLAVPVQGGAYPDLRARSALEASTLGDVLAIGGVVPLMEQYRYPELVGVLVAARPNLSPGAAVHLFGTGHPMVFSLAALFGIDLFDSSAYLKFAKRGDLLFPEGTVALEDLRERTCACFLCAEHPLTEIASLPASERERRVAYHNLLTSMEEIGRVRQAIRDGTLWELAERRAGGHPAVRAALEAARARPEVFLPTEPESRRAFREVDSGSRARPGVRRFLARTAAISSGRGPVHILSRLPLRPDYLRNVPATDRSDVPIAWDVRTPLGLVPLELADLYPVGPYLGIEEFVRPVRHRPPSAIAQEVAEAFTGDFDRDRDWSATWTARQIASLLAWRYGRPSSARMLAGLTGERSRASGRLRAIAAEGRTQFHLGTDGIPRPTFEGARRLHRELDPGRERVTVHEDAVPFVRAGRTLFARFVRDGDPALVPGCSALLVDGADDLLAVGRLLLAPFEATRFSRGVAAWVTSHERSGESDTGGAAAEAALPG
jgi:7-cyano-7-deazaguanine tRNA-ribosyltransferase